MDLDDEELKATRRMNGSDKNVACVEENIEGLKRLFYANALTQYGKRKLIDYYEQLIKELEEKWDKDTHKLQNDLDLANADKINNYIPVSLVEEKIEELNKQEKQELKGLKGQERYFVKQMYQYKRSVLQELLEKRK